MGKSRQPKSKRKAPAKVEAPPAEKPKLDPTAKFVAILTLAGTVVTTTGTIIIALFKGGH